MPGLYDIDFDQQAVDLLPVDKRSEENVTLLRSLLSGQQWIRDLILGSFKTGSTAPDYTPGTYSKFDQVVFNKGLYESLVDANTDDPTVLTSWRQLLDNFIGLDERIKYNGQKLVLEWALNKEFDGVFRQPVTGLNSDIYIDLVAAVLVGFHIGETEAGSSSIGNSTASASIGGSFPFVQVNNFNINIPSALLAITNEPAIRNFVNKYIPKSLNYTITPY